MIASQLLPSCSSPSPVSTNVRQGAPSSLAAERHADGDRQAVAERPGVGLDAGHLVAVGVAVQLRQRLHVGVELLRRERTRARRAWRRARPTRGPCSGRSGRGPGSRGDAGRQPQHVEIEHREDVGAGQVAARMPHARLVHHAQAGAPDAPRPLEQRRRQPSAYLCRLLFSCDTRGNLPAASADVNAHSDGQSRRSRCRIELEHGSPLVLAAHRRDVAAAEGGSRSRARRCRACPPSPTPRRSLRSPPASIPTCQSRG